MGFSLRWLLLLQSAGSKAQAQQLWHMGLLAPWHVESSWSLLRFLSIESRMLSNHLILCCPLLLLPSLFPSLRVFSNESALCTMWPKYWGFSFSLSPSNEYSGLISFRIDWLDLLAVQGILKSLLQHHNSKASIHTVTFKLWARKLWRRQSP